MKISLKQLFKLANRLFYYLLLVLVAACGSGSNNDDDGNTNTPNSSQGSLSGIIKQSNGLPLKDATISLTPSARSTKTDASGQFVIADLDPDKYIVNIDGSTGSGATGTKFGALVVMATVASKTASSLEQVIFLPDLNNIATASTEVAVVDGFSSAEITAVKGQVSLRGAANTNIKLGGINAAESVDISVTPVPLSQLPMVLNSGEANIADFVTIQPPNATFDPPLDLRIPNTQNLPLGTKVNIWSFDHDIEAWVNRSDQTGNKGVVVADGNGGTLIEALGVITKGGWHGPTAPAVVLTTVTGIVVDNNGNPLAGVTIFTNSGQLGVSQSDGSFSIENVTTDPVVITLTSPIALGGLSTSVVQPAVDQGTTDFGTITLSVPTTGQLAGRALSLLGPSMMEVIITGPDGTQNATPAADGSFFVANFAPGNYTASTTFAGDTTATRTDFVVSIGQISFILLQQLPSNGETGSPGSGNQPVAVKVFVVGENFVDAQLANDTDLIGQVQIQQSANNLSQTTDATGIASFNLDSGSFSVTAQMDIENTGLTSRTATTVFFDNPPANGEIGVFVSNLSFDVNVGNSSFGAIAGNITNIPDLADGFDLVIKIEQIGDQHNSEKVLVLSGPITNVDDQPYRFDSVDVGTYQVWAEIHQKSLLNGQAIDYAAAAILTTTINVTENNTLTVPNLDFSNAEMKVSFGNKNITVNNIDADILKTSNQSFDYSVESLITTVDGLEFYFPAVFGSDLDNIPISAMMVISHPSMITSNIAEFEIEADQRNTIQDNVISASLSQTASVPISSAMDITFDLLDLPVISQPSPMVVEYTPAQLSTFNITWSGSNLSNLSSVFIGSIDNPNTPLINETGVAGIDEIIWSVIAPGHQKSFSLPNVTLPMFGIDGRYGFNLSDNMIGGDFNYQQLFDHDIITNLDNSIKSGSIYSQREFSAFGVASP